MSQRTRVGGLALPWGLLAFSLLTSVHAAEVQALKITVDARELPRKLLHARVVIPCAPGHLVFWYPRWVPGTHEPCGPVENLGGLRVLDPSGAAIPWKRDELDLYRFHCEVPTGARAIEVALDLICNEPSILASGHLSYGTRGVAILNWSNVFVYPEGRSCNELEAELTVLMPDDWKYASALKTRTHAPGRIQFEPVSLFELADRPLVAGRYLKSIKLDSGTGPDAYLDVVGETESAVEVKPAVADAYGRVVREAQALFGACHYPEYHFLTTSSNALGYFGLEHRTSSVDGLREGDLLDANRLRGWVANLLPHEYVHSWCGKFRRPAGMITEDFHTPYHTSLLWVYEGLGEYLGELLMTRSGLVPPAEYRRGLGASLSSLSHVTGRRWRSLEDTAICTSQLRGQSPNWQALRRGQDYYFEGMLVWLEADAIIRDCSGGKKSLDDFCRRFFGSMPSKNNVVPYNEAEIVDILRSLADYPWEQFLNARVHKPMESLALEVVGRVGYRLDYTDQLWTHSISRERAGVDALESLGLMLDGEGSISSLIPGSIADRAGLDPGSRIIGVGGKLYSHQHFLDELGKTRATHKLELLVADEGALKPVELAYAEGVRYRMLVRDPSRPDLLAEIARPLTRKHAEPKQPRAAADSPAMPKGYVCGRTATPIVIDGRLDEASWKAAPWTDLFVDIEGDVRPRPRFETRAKMLWDDRYFYIAAEIKDPHVWATLTKHDSVIFQDNDFEIFIDPDGDNHEYYEIEINALNTEWDLYLGKPYRDGGPAQNEWEIPGLKTAVSVQGTLNNPGDRDQGWTVEFAIPWSVLGEHAHRVAPPSNGDQWRINFSRVEWQHEIKDGKYQKVPKTREDNWVWSPQGAIDMHRPERWGFVQFSTQAPGQAAFVPDHAQRIRDRLMAVYHAQRAFHEKHKRYAGSLEELGQGPEAKPSIKLQLTADGYTAEIRDPSGDEETVWSIRQDSQIQSR